MTLYDNKLDKSIVIKNTPDYIVKILIGGREYKFWYGAYHNIWLNTNELKMTVFVHPSKSVKIEFWTGYHPGQGRRIFMDGERTKTIVNKGIMRSLRITSLKKEDYSKYVNLHNITIGKDYQPHNNVENYDYHKNSNIFNSNIFKILILIFLYFLHHSIHRPTLHLD